MTTALSIGNIRPVSKKEASRSSRFSRPIYPYDGQTARHQTLNHEALPGWAVVKGSLCGRSSPLVNQALPKVPLLELIYVFNPMVCDKRTLVLG